MMHNNNFVVSVKSNGKVLREFGDKVYLPFNSEFSIYLKNLDSRRAKVNISIDGSDVLSGNQLVIDGNSFIDLQRFIKNNNWYQGNRFKFIERTDKIEEHRGIKPEDGLIRIEFAYEVQYRYPLEMFRPRIDYYYSPRIYTGDNRVYYGGNTLNYAGNTRGGGGAGGGAGGGGSNVSYGSGGNITCCSSSLKNDTGITVPGSVSTQKFIIGDHFYTDSSSVIVIKLVGETETNKIVKNPITVKHKRYCETCGKVNKVSAKFCTECGTSLEII